jgi:O-antigen/teichoic acid export membrane protein
MSVQKRIMTALAASAFGQLVTMSSQIVLTPMFFKFWGAEKYGEWLILSSIPAYLTMADMGIGSAAGNEMTMRAGAGDRPGAQKTFRGALRVAAGAGAIAFGLGLIAAAVIHFFGKPATPHIYGIEAAMVLLLLALTVAVGFVSGVVSAGFRCGERNALGIVLSNSSRLFEALVMGGLLAMGYSPVWLCGGALAVKMLLLLIQMYLLYGVTPWLFTPYEAPERGLIRRLIAPSIGFLAFPLGNAIALQGPILIIGAVFGGGAVALFSAMRTLARLPMQITNAFNSSVWPEMSRAFGAADYPLLRRLHRQAWGATTLLTTVSGIGLWLLGPKIASLWLGSQATYSATFLNSLIVVTAISAAWNASSVVLAAINAHARLGLIYVVVNGLTLLLAYSLTPAFGWLALLGGMLMAEVILTLYVMPCVLSITRDRSSSFLKGAIFDGVISIRQRLAALTAR